jgi:hypothetical protein
VIRCLSLEGLVTCCLSLKRLLTSCLSQVAMLRKLMKLKYRDEWDIVPVLFARKPILKIRFPLREQLTTIHEL